MTEREQEPPPFWQQDVLIGEAPVRGERTSIRLRVHTSPERYGGREELYPLTQRRGERLYVLAKPYILEPQITLSIGLYPTPTARGAIGEVVGSEWEGMRHQDIGNAQGWCYPADRLIVLWECYLVDAFRQEEPTGDEALLACWTGFERVLLERLPGAERIVTPSWEDIYERASWQAFLRSQGYGPFSQRAFLKAIGH